MTLESNDFTAAQGRGELALRILVEELYGPTEPEGWQRENAQRALDRLKTELGVPLPPVDSEFAALADDLEALGLADLSGASTAMHAAARANIREQEDLVDRILRESPLELEETARRLGLTDEELQGYLARPQDLSLAEIRMLAVASEVVLSYGVSVVR